MNIAFQGLQYVMNCLMNVQILALVHARVNTALGHECNNVLLPALVMGGRLVVGGGGGGGG